MRFFAMLSCSMLAIGLAAQSSAGYDSRLEAGVGFGNFQTEFDFRPSIDQIAVDGLHAGVALRYFDRSFVGIQAELGYQQAGWQQQFSDLDMDYRRSIDWLVLQIMTQINIGKGRFQPLLQGGPYLHYPVGDRERIPVGFTPPQEEQTAYGRPYPGRLTYGLIFGGGARYRIGRIAVQGEARLLVGISDLYRAGTTEFEGSRRQSIGWRATVFYSLKAIGD